MADIDDTALRKGLEKLRMPQQDIDDLFWSSPPRFPQVRYGFVVYPGFIKWLRDFDDHTAEQLMQQTQGIPYTLLHVRDRYLRMKRAYEKRVLCELKAMLNRSTGRAILSEIQAASRLVVSIRPYLADDDDDYNAQARMLNEKEATRVGMPILDTSGRPTGGSGTGEGSDVAINFSPKIWGVFSESPTQRPGRCKSSCKQPTGPGSQADEVLFHELVHAGRIMRGLHYRMNVNQDYDNEEEFLAVVITNIYLAEKNQTQLRGSHRGHIYLDNPQKFLDNPQHVNLSPRMLLERFRLTQVSLFQALADIGPSVAWFNPVRDYNEELKQGKGPPA